MESVHKCLAVSVHVPAQLGCALVQGRRTGFQEEEYALQCTGGEQEQPKGGEHRKKEYENDDDCLPPRIGPSDDAEAKLYSGLVLILLRWGKSHAIYPAVVKHASGAT